MLPSAGSMTLANSTCGAVHLRSLSRQKLGRNSAERHKCLQLVQTGSLGGTLPMASTTFCNQEASKSLTISLWYFCLAKSKGLLPQAANAARTKTIRVTSGSSNLRFIKDRFDDSFISNDEEQQQQRKQLPCRPRRSLPWSQPPHKFNSRLKRTIGAIQRFNPFLFQKFPRVEALQLNCRLSYWYSLEKSWGNTPNFICSDSTSNRTNQQFWTCVPIFFCWSSLHVEPQASLQMETITCLGQKPLINGMLLGFSIGFIYEVFMDGEKPTKEDRVFLYTKPFLYHLSHERLLLHLTEQHFHDHFLNTVFTNHCFIISLLTGVNQVSHGVLLAQLVNKHFVSGILLYWKDMHSRRANIPHNSCTITGYIESQ